jgi:hypothetical protein
MGVGSLSGGHVIGDVEQLVVRECSVLPSSFEGTLHCPLGYMCMCIGRFRRHSRQPNNFDWSNALNMPTLLLDVYIDVQCGLRK